MYFISAVAAAYDNHDQQSTRREHFVRMKNGREKKTEKQPITYGNL
jgi:hypothetical protein